jgi:20S proteasome subunit alpha 3
MYAGWDKI